MWRPKDWNKVRAELHIARFPDQMEDQELSRPWFFEMGADEVLKAMGELFSKEKCLAFITDSNHAFSWDYDQAEKMSGWIRQSVKED